MFFLFEADMNARPGARGCLGIFDTWELAYDEADKYSDATIATIADSKLVTIAYIQDGYKWYFYDGCPFYPYKFKPGDPVTYLEGGKKRFGEIEWGLYNTSGYHDEPEIEYVVNGTFVNETRLTKLDVTPTS